MYPPSVDRCRATRRSVYEQHRRLGRDLLSHGLIPEFEVVTSPGARIVYRRYPATDSWGGWDGISYVYKPDVQGWRLISYTFNKSTGAFSDGLRRAAKRLAAGESAFTVLGNRGDPYELR